MVPVLVFTVAPFQWRHNARCTTLEWLERSSMRFKLSTLMPSESQSEKGSRSVTCVEASLLASAPVGRVVCFEQPTYPTLKHAYVQVLLKSPNGRWHVGSLRLSHPLVVHIPRWR
jgi:hypothetical protein